MDLGAFFGVVATVDFALLGLWWVAVQARPDLRGKKTSRMSYLVSIQFSVPGAAALLAQIAPQLSMVWRISFAVGGFVGVMSIVLLVPTLAENNGRLVPRLMLLGGLPLYAVIAILALIPSHLYAISSRFGAVQVEGVFFCLLAFVGTQIAWAAAMSPEVKVDVPAASSLM